MMRKPAVVEYPLDPSDWHRLRVYGVEVDRAGKEGAANLEALALRINDAGSNAVEVAHAKLICREFPCNAPFEVGDGGIDDESERELAANAWADGWNACRAEFMKRLG